MYRLRLPYDEPCRYVITVPVCVCVISLTVASRVKATHTHTEAGEDCCIFPVLWHVWINIQAVWPHHHAPSYTLMADNGIMRTAGFHCARGNTHTLPTDAGLHHLHDGTGVSLSVAFIPSVYIKLNRLYPLEFSNKWTRHGFICSVVCFIYTENLEATDTFLLCNKLLAQSWSD